MIFREFTIWIHNLSIEYHILRLSQTLFVVRVRIDFLIDNDEYINICNFFAMFVTCNKKSNFCTPLSS